MRTRSGRDAVVALSTTHLERVRLVHTSHDQAEIVEDESHVLHGWRK